MTVRIAPVPGMCGCPERSRRVAGDGGEPRLCETSMAQWRQLEVHSVGGGLDGGNAGLARGVERVGAGEEFRGVGDAVAVGVEPHKPKARNQSYLQWPYLIGS